MEVYNTVADAQHIYVNTVKGFRKGTTSQGDLDAQFADFSLIASDLASQLMVYGINVYKFTERIK